MKKTKLRYRMLQLLQKPYDVIANFLDDHPLAIDYIIWIGILLIIIDIILICYRLITIL